MDPLRQPVIKNTGSLMMILWYLENRSSSMNQNIPVRGTLSKMVNTIKNTDTLLVNGMLSSALPAVNTDAKYLTNLDHGDIIGGSQLSRYSGKQVMNSGNHSKMIIAKQNKMVIMVMKSGGRSSVSSKVFPDIANC